jgi:serine protease Do
LPITLSVLYIELAHRIGVNLVGVGLPGHFVVKHVPAKGAGEFLDVYEGGRSLTLKEARQIVRDYTGRPPTDSDFASVSKKAILVRMLHNLMGIARAENDLKAGLRYLDTILAVSPDSANEHMLRAAARYQVGNREGALQDVDWILDHHPDNIDLDRVREFRRVLERPER